ncbi:lysophospholipid acyltransferase family protein [Teichococcus vastitatis]|uniref:lysophospholipid acyltransferase family protein n=1 Tax=Teichococcus vastitatis TaxID=2307076 RepID=UPI001EE4182B|nr:lysophospholipid acyltransferase family protein [Pseudoroseomonas vastitatis]
MTRDLGRTQDDPLERHLGPPGALTLLRSALFNVLFFGVTGLWCLFGMLLLPFPRRLMRRYVRGYAHLMLWLLRVVCGISLRVTGWENLPPGPVVIAAKHQSAYDTIVWLALLPEPVYVLKQELLRIPAWGWMAQHYGAVAVDRQGGASALKRMVRQAGAALRAGDQIVIFPEGTRTAVGTRVSYLPGVVALAAASGAPVVPVATDSGLRWGRRAFAKRPGAITVAILPPLPPGQPRVELLRSLSDAIETETDRLVMSAGGPAAIAVDNSVG